MQFSRTVLWPPGSILKEEAMTSRTPVVESGSSMMVFPLKCISFHVSSLVQMTLTKFMAVKSVPNIMCLVMCLQTINDCVNCVSLVVNV